MDSIDRHGIPEDIIEITEQGDAGNQRDKLTSLLNRKTFDDQILKIIEHHRRSGLSVEPAGSLRRTAGRSHLFWLGMIDIDNFKKINDTYGHLFGVEALIPVAKLMTRTFRHDDCPFRYGGEEFLAIIRASGEDDTIRATQFKSMIDTPTPAPLHCPENDTGMNRSLTSRISLSILLAAALLAALASCAADTAPRAAHGAQGPVEPRMEVFIETDGPLALHAVLSSPYQSRFSPASETPPYVRGGGGGLWLRFRLDEPGSATREGWILELAPSFAIILDYADLYLPTTGDGGRRAYSRLETGAKRPMREGEIPSRSFLFEVPEGTLRADYAYLRMESATDVSFEVRQWHPVDFGVRAVRYFLAFGLIYGILIAMIAYNFFIFVSLRDRAYLFYILYMLSALLWQLHVQGHGRMLLGTFPGTDLSALWVLIGSVQLWGGVFSIDFLALRRHMPRVHVAIVALTAVGALTAGAGILGLHRAAFDLSHFGGLSLPVAVIIAAVLRLRQGYAPARFYVFAWSMLSAGGIAFALMGLKLLPVSFWTVNGVSLGMAAESLLLSLALADRIRTLKEEKDFFEKSQKRYMELSITDGLTGLYNRRYLQSKLESELQHSLRLEQPLSLVMLDLDDFKAVNDLYGHAFGDVVLSRLAAVMRTSSREVDVACRYGGEEFALIMPGTHGEDAVHTAERIRARFAAEVFTTEDGTSLKVTISLGVAELRKDDTADALLEHADRAMYRAKRLGKNRTEM